MVLGDINISWGDEWLIFKKYVFEYVDNVCVI